MVSHAAGSTFYNRNAPRRAVNLSINEDLLLQAKRLTKNLSGTVEELLAGHVQTELARKQADDEKIDQIIDILNAFNEEHGFLSDEFSTL